MPNLIKKKQIRADNAKTIIPIKATKTGSFLLLFSLLFCSQLFTSCATKQKTLEKAAATPVLITYQKERMRGDRIPRYSIELLEGKVAKYTGIANVNFIGERIIEVDNATFEKIIAQYNAINFKDFKASYKGKKRDLPLTSITYKDHKVSYQQEACPSDLEKLAALMEDLVK